MCQGCIIFTPLNVPFLKKHLFFFTLVCGGIHSCGTFSVNSTNSIIGLWGLPPSLIGLGTYIIYMHLHFPRQWSHVHLPVCTNITCEGTHLLEPFLYIHWRHPHWNVERNSFTLTKGFYQHFWQNFTTRTNTYISNMPKSFLIKKKQKREHHSLRHENQPSSPVKISRSLDGTSPASPLCVRKVLLQPDDLGSDAENVPPSPSSPAPYQHYNHHTTTKCKQSTSVY